MWKYMLGMGFVGRIEKPDIALLAGRPLQQREVFREVCMIDQQCKLSSVIICFVWSVNTRSEVCGGRID